MDVVLIVVICLKREFFSSSEDALQGGIEVDEAFVSFRGDWYQEKS